MDRKEKRGQPGRERSSKSPAAGAKALRIKRFSKA